jgi:outer membrane biosynthesis protein TonB
MFANYPANDVFLCVASVQLAYWLLWAGSFVLTAVLVVLLYTRWGHSKPLHKCAALSLIVHLILAFLTMTVRIVSGDGTGGGGGGGDGGPIHVRILEDKAPAHAIVTNTALPATEVTPPPLLTPPPPKKEEPKAVAEVAKPEAQSEAPPLIVAAPLKDSAKQIIEPKVAKAKPPEAEPQETTKTATKTEPRQSDVVQSFPDQTAVPRATTTTPITEVAASTTTGTYSLRSAPGRLGLIAGQGGNAQTEAAVAAALGWLAAAQSRDGRWDAVQFGGGQEELTLGQNRGGAGQGADTGVTALALLAFLGAGHSHMHGEYQDNVRRGLDFLLRSQATDGSLFGEATLYAQMYCHSMATFALAEAQALSGDRRLEAAVTKSVSFSLAAQNTSTGGWRYRPGDTGDTSQLGWQVMALASAERAGITVPQQTWDRVQRFLGTVQRGSNGGLASYRPDSPFSTSMTAEALYCRLILEQMNGVNLTESAAAEATTQLLATPPSAERINLYYWYYATLALHHRQNSSEAAKTAWRKWNDGMTAALTKSQITVGNDAGSWNSNTIWGGYGGRIYTTAMAAMCLEVYYRYAPAPGPQGRWTAARPQSPPVSR